MLSESRRFLARHVRGRFETLRGWVCSFLIVSAPVLIFISSLAAPARADGRHTDPNQAHFSTPSDPWIPNLAHPDLVHLPQHIVHSVKNGAWSDATVWDGPIDSDAVVYVLHAVDFDSAQSTVAAVAVFNTLKFVGTQSTELRLMHLIVHEGGYLEIGTAANPIAAPFTAAIVFRNAAINTTNSSASFYDPGQYGNGLLAFGKVTMHGAAKNDTFVRLSAEPKAGDTTLALETPVTGWMPNDKLILPDSQQRGDNFTGPQWEELRIANVSLDGKVITLTAPLQFNHPGARNGADVLEFLPHVANLTRNVVVRSESAAGVRGHAFFLSRADIDIRYSGFVGMGRTTNYSLDDTLFDAGGQATHVGTNQQGRYPVHFHHLAGPQTTPADGYQFTFIGNAVFCPMPDHHFKWGLTILDSHYGLIQDNVLYNWAGAGLATAQGNESFNVIAHNFVMRGTGIGGREADGNEGQAYWLRGPNNYVRDNVATNYFGSEPEAAYGFKYAMHTSGNVLGSIDVPNFKGADTSQAGQSTTRNGNGIPLLEFARNEAYGIENALTIWYLNAIDVPQNGGPSIVQDFRAWHFSKYGFYGYPMAAVTFDGFVVRGDKSVLTNYWNTNLGIWFGDYLARDVVIRHADIQGMRTGIIDPYQGGAVTRIEDSFLENTVDISNVTPGIPGSAANSRFLLPKTLIVRNVRFGSTGNWDHGGRTPESISMDYDLHDNAANLTVSDKVYVYGFNGASGDDFQVYYPQQAPDFVLPQTSGNLIGSPQAGLTNQQNWTQLGVALAGAVAPCSTARAAINGFVCPLPSDSTAPRAPAGLRIQ